MSNGVSTDVKGEPIDDIRVGSAIVWIYASPTKHTKASSNTNGEASEINGATTTKIYESYLVVWYEGGKREATRRSTLANARKLAKEIAGRLSQNASRAEFVTERDRRIYSFAQAAIKPLAKDVDEICRLYVEADSVARRFGVEVGQFCREHAELLRRLKSGSLIEAVDFWNSHAQRVKLDASVKEVYAAYLLDLGKRGVGDYHLRDIKRYVGSFVEAHPILINHVQTHQIDAFLDSRGGKARSKNNFRDALIAFFAFAQKKGFLPTNLPHAAENTTEYGDPRTKITSEEHAKEMLQPTDIYLPAQMRLLIAAAEDEPVIRVTIETKAFSGVRTEEIVRLWWPMMAEAEGCIRVPDAVGKINARQVPILPNLQRRLAAYSSEMKRGRVAADWESANSMYHAWQRVCKKAGVPYLRNGFRNSYFTYRLVIVGDPKKVAAEGGTSEEMLKKNYLSRAPVSKSDAEEWFSI